MLIEKWYSVEFTNNENYNVSFSLASYFHMCLICDLSKNDEFLNKKLSWYYKNCHN